LPPPALDEDPIRHIAVHRQEGRVAGDFARTRHELRSHPLPALTDFGPTTFAEGQLRLIARNARRMYDRAGQLLEVVRAAAASDSDIEALWRGINDERLARAHTSARRLASKAKLRTTVGEAARTLWVLSVPELYVLQIRTGGLDPDDYERWLGDLLVAALLVDHKP
jgi:hypothetical protein